ncbi:YhdP family protein [Methylomonas albis]|uniref:TIGR02099 family protein n=1 Tax=Methylomonas albis TaxID=1854563 RepID=A0ABR9CU55_9GAMM|nr:YhdP family protein [Methylomonas albis]MBD9354303.1 TIGR02099 family protein [Methylomonas albis]
MVIHHVTRATRHLLFWSLIAIALVLSAVRIFLIGIADYRSTLEQKVRQTTGIPLHIGKLGAKMRGFSPELLLREIAIEGVEAGSQPAIRLKEVRIGIDLLEWLLTQDPMAASWVTLVGAKLDILRNEDGSLSIKGLQSSDEQPLWLLQGGKYEILQSQVTWLDLKRHRPPVTVEQFDLLIKNHYLDQSHEIHLLSSLPEQYGDSLRISAQLKGNIFQANAINGQIYVEGNNLQGPAWLIEELPLGLRLESGSGDMRIWSQWRNSMPYQVSGYLQGQQIKIAGQQGKTLQLDTFEGNLGWTEQDGRQRWSVYDVNIFANHQRWRDGEVYLQQDAQGNLSGVIKQLNLQALMHLVPPFLPADQSDFGKWLPLNPRGNLLDLAFYTDSSRQRYALRGRFSQLGNDAQGEVPQIQALSGSITASDQGGQLIFDTTNAKFNAEQMFRSSLDIPRLQGQIDWRQTASDWQISSENLQLDSADFQTQTRLQLSIPKNNDSAVIDMRTRFGNFKDISTVPQYLPAKIMGKDAVAWLDDAFIGGHINKGEMLLRGKLADFPFTTGPGRFEVVFAIDDGEIQFNALWPHLRGVHADVQFLGADMTVAINGGRSENVDINQAVVSIPDLADSNYVYVLGQVQSKLPQSLQYLQKTPLRAKIDPLAKVLAPDGNTQVDLDLKIAYYETLPTTVKVDAHLDKARLLVKPVDLAVNDISGVLRFTEDRVSSNRMEATTLGYPIRAVLQSDSNATQILIDGMTDINRLEKQFSFLKNQVADGSLNYQAVLTLPYDAARPSTLSIDSNLQGVTINTQHALAKSADQEQALNLNFSFDNSPYLPLKMAYGKELNAALLIDGKQNQLHSGHIVFGREQADFFQAAGLKLEIKQPQFKLSDAIAAFTDNETQQRLPALKEIILDTEQLIWQGQNIGALKCRLQHVNQAWQATLDSPMARGKLTVPDQRGGANVIKLQMDYLNLSAMDGLNFDAAEEVVTDLPLIDIDSKQLLWRGVDLGNLKLHTERLINGIHFKHVQLASVAGTIDFSAEWLKVVGGSSTQLTGKLNMNGFGLFLSQLGFTDDLRGTHAEINFNAGWRGAPQQFSTANLTGQMQLKFSDGRISSIEPGFGRLLGLIAMEQWAKRLSLDFTDVYRQGLAFDQITGDFKISNGLAYTDNLLIDAVSAKLSIAGTADLVKKTMDHRVAVVPKSSGAVPIAGTIVGGIASIITQVVTDDYKEGYFFGSQYKLAGPWGNVEVTPLHDQDGLVQKAWRGLTGGWLESLSK